MTRTLMIPGCPLPAWTESLGQALWGLVRAPAEAAGSNLGTAARAEPDAEESAWIRAARGGDSEAFRKLVDRYGDRSFETALRIVRHREEAEEVAQDAFVRAWQALPNFREEARFSTWLYRIVTRRAIDRARAVRQRGQREIASEPDVVERVASPDAGEPSGSWLRRLNRILGELDPVPAAAVTLFYLRDRSVREVAEILDLPEGTVKTHLHRSRAALRRAWQRDERQERDHGLPGI